MSFGEGTLGGKLEVERRVEELYAKYGSPRWAGRTDPDTTPGRHLDLHAEFERLQWVIYCGFLTVENDHPQRDAPTFTGLGLRDGPADLALLRQLVDLEAELAVTVPVVQALLQQVLALPCRSQDAREEVQKIVACARDLEAPDMSAVDAIERTLLHACSPVLQLDGLFEATPKLMRLYKDYATILYELREELVSYACSWIDTLEAVINAVKWMAPVVASMADIDVLHHSKFERLVADLLDRDGYRVLRSGGGAGDQGADVLAVDEFGRYIMVQAKHFTGGKGSVGQPVAQHLYGGANAIHPSTLPIVVTNGTFTGSAKVWSKEQYRVRLIGREELARWSEGGESLASVLRPRY
ncbi:restriction endonuclease [Streptomyces tanashiensis]|uniref:restriction endonuclease n=1 Tax=Streptomyces tanashiensis TaxID=67367 RepID=UPI003419E271